VSRQLVVGTLVGSARMLDETGREPAELRAAVTSPGGTTAAAVRTLEFKAVRSAFIEAVAAAVERSRQLGR
jgi:pyrroline-5-carboxylate reductase